MTEILKIERSEHEKISEGNRKQSRNFSERKDVFLASTRVEASRRMSQKHGVFPAP